MSELSTLRDSIRQFLNLELVDTPVNYEVGEIVSCTGYTRERIIYTAADIDPVCRR